MLWLRVDSGHSTTNSPSVARYQRVETPQPVLLEKQLEHLEKTTGKSKEFFCQEALTQYLEDVEDLYMALKVKNQKLYTTQEVLDNLKSRKSV